MRYRTVVYEAAFRYPVGSAEIMESQLDRLIKLNELANISVQIVPFDAGRNSMLEGSFRLIRLASDRGELVCVEGLVGEFLMEDESTVQRHAAIFDHLAGVKALGEPESVE